MKSLLKNKVFLTVLALIVIAAAVTGIAVFRRAGIKAGVIAEGVSAGGVNLGGMTKAQASAAMDGYADFAKDMVLSFECEDISFSVPASQINLKPDSDSTADKAYAVGRTKDPKKNKETLKKAKKDGISIDVAFSYDRDKLLLTAADYLGSKITDPSPMTVDIGDNCLVVTNSAAGKVVSARKLDEAIAKELSDFKADDAIKLVIVEEKPDNLTFDEFAKQYVREPKDAVYTKDGDTHHIEPEVVGIELDLTEARRIFEENQNNTDPYEIPAVITKPEITAKYLEDKYVNKIMATYSTSYAGSSANRCVNIALAASKIDGYVINPGARFSYNAVVGPRTEAAGFKSAHVYVGTQVVDGIGGGICQVSSTLYNAVVLADLKTVTRVNHSMPVNYVPLGRDATVSYGTIDYVFENNKPYPVSIKATTSGTTLTISIVGTSDMDYTVDFVTKFISSVPYGTTTEEDNALAEGEKKVLSPGSDGSVYESYRVYKRGGVEYDRKFESRSRYQPVAAKVAIGTKKADEPKQEVPPVITEPEAVIPPEPEDTDIPKGDINDEIIHPEDNSGNENQSELEVESEE